MRLESPLFLLLLLALPLLLLLMKREKKNPSLSYSRASFFKNVPSTFRTRLRNLPLCLRIGALLLLIMALARPQMGTGKEEITSRGIDIMLTVDISGSMSTTDIEPTRIEGAKAVAKNFVDKRAGDRIGLTVFAANSFMQCPLTLDHGVLTGLIEESHIGMTEDGTAIGMAIATGLNRLRDSKAKSRIMILLTDGVNNAGNIDPLTAADMARALEIKIYTVAVGKEGTAYRIVEDPFWGKRKIPVQTEIDEETLKEIAEKTEGRYYRATNLDELRQIYDEIDKLEKVEVKSRRYVLYTELFPYFLYGAFFLVLAELALAQTWLRRLP